MPLQIVRNDITKIECDAVVNAANYTLLGGGGVDGAIHRAAGKELLLECMKLGGCKVGEAKITKGYKLTAKYIIHTVGPVWHGGDRGEGDLLSLCYENSLALAKANGCNTVAFPLISSGTFSYPKDEALQIAITAISGFLLHNDMNVILAVYDKSSFAVSEKLIADITEYIDDCYIETYFESDRTMMYTRGLPENNAEDFFECMPSVGCKTGSLDLTQLLGKIDESFSEMLLRKIDECGMTDTECYKKANIDRKLFSKIRSDINYKPSKVTVIAFAIALRLNLSETQELLKKAGFALSHSNKFDIIIEYFIEHKNYNVFEINEVLFQFDQSLLGA